MPRAARRPGHRHLAQRIEVDRRSSARPSSATCAGRTAPRPGHPPSPPPRPAPRGTGGCLTAPPRPRSRTAASPAARPDFMSSRPRPGRNSPLAKSACAGMRRVARRRGAAGPASHPSTPVAARQRRQRAIVVGADGVEMTGSTTVAARVAREGGDRRAAERIARHRDRPNLAELGRPRQPRPQPAANTPRPPCR